MHGLDGEEEGVPGRWGASSAGAEQDGTVAEWGRRGGLGPQCAPYVATVDGRRRHVAESWVPHI